MNVVQLDDYRTVNVRNMVRLYHGYTLNGIACPRCSGELVDTTATQHGMNVFCGRCSFRSTRLD
jgi:DNA-directed RNA polymerase subunit RPC12/RpoP